MIAVLAVLVALLFLVSLVLFLRGGKRLSWLEFYVKGVEAGFSLREIHILSASAKLAGVQDTTNLFWSPRDLDRTISRLLAKEGVKAPEGGSFLEKVYDLRKRLEFEQPRYKAGIHSSRQIAAGQRLRLLLQGVGVFACTLVESNSQFLVVSYPAGTHLPRDFQWKGQRASVYFWRKDDAGYVFDSYILDDMRVRSIPVIHLAHSESLLRTQKRKSVRSRVRTPASLYILKRIEGAFEKVERETGLRCIVQDLSEDGFAALIGGKAKVGMAVKAQFFVAEHQIVMSGTVKSVDFDAEANRSVLHVEAVTPSPRMKGAIRSCVYNIRGQIDLGEA
jgi:c-di-GMP-binding flagellar brake protein YcgR